MVVYAVRKPAGRIASVRSLGADQAVVRLDPAVGEELEAAWRYLRSTGRPRVTRRDLASAGIANYLAALRDELVDGEPWPEPNLTLFDAEERSRVHGRTDLSRTPRVPTPRVCAVWTARFLSWLTWTAAASGMARRERERAEAGDCFLDEPADTRWPTSGKGLA